jgi:hypothetical protein
MGRDFGYRIYQKADDHVDHSDSDDNDRGGYDQLDTYVSRRNSKIGYFTGSKWKLAKTLRDLTEEYTKMIDFELNFNSDEGNDLVEAIRAYSSVLDKMRYEDYVDIKYE